MIVPDTSAIVVIVKNESEATRALVEDPPSLVMDMDDAAADRIGDAPDRFGKDRHPARPNFGDLFAYEAARRPDAPPLCVGEDFAMTDVRATLARKGEG